jgi:hypothetical protein
MLSRRSFIRALVAAGSLSLLPRIKTWDSASAGPAGSGSASQTEEYAGFLLLPEGTPVPDSVVYPPRSEHAVITSHLARPSDLARMGGFTLYVPATVPSSLRDAGCSLLSRPRHVPIAGYVLYKAADHSRVAPVTRLSIAAERVFPSPFPLWSSEPVEPGGPAVVLEKVSFLPSPGIMVPTAMGYAFHWIKDEVLYTLLAEYGPSRSEATALAERLVPVG